MPAATPLDVWNGMVSALADPGAVCAELAVRMRERRLTFGGRLLCPFLRPFFLSREDESLVKEAAEMLWTLGERVAQMAMTDPTLLADLGLSDEEILLARIDPGYPTTSTTARADAFVLPGSLQFAEYNGESPAGAAYAEGLADVFENIPLMDNFRKQFAAERYHPVARLREALLASFQEWSGGRAPELTAIVDWREVPTYSEFEILAEAFTTAGTPTIICDPRDLECTATGLFAGGRRIDFVYRRVLINDMVARPVECRPLVDAYERRLACVANSLRCKIPHKKAFFAVLTDARRAQLFSDGERALIRRHVPWTAIVRDGRVSRDGESIDLLPYLRRHRDTFVVKPNDEYGGTGVVLGWEADERAWDAAIDRAVREPTWVAQEKIAIRRELFPICADGAVDLRDMLVDFAPYVFRGRLAGFLTRLSATSLANVTSGGGQVPAFRVQGFNVQGSRFLNPEP